MRTIDLRYLGKRRGFEYHLNFQSQIDKNFCFHHQIHESNDLIHCLQILHQKECRHNLNKKNAGNCFQNKITIRKLQWTLSIIWIILEFFNFILNKASVNNIFGVRTIIEPSMFFFFLIQINCDVFWIRNS